MKHYCIILTLLLSMASGLAKDVPSNFLRENLHAWAIVPYDATHRGPAERAAMLRELGMTRCAYDWRKQHVPEFEEEILQYKKHGIEYVAFWGGREEAYELFKKYKMSPQIWRTLRVAESVPDAKKVQTAVDSLLPVVEQAAELGSKYGLYNHGGWGGEPENLVAVCKAFRELGHEHVGIVYNFHHGHGHSEHFSEYLNLMLPYLLCINLNGMVSEAELAKSADNKIKPIGSGTHEAAMIKAIVESGYTGPIGIIGHTKTKDVKQVLEKNLDGLARILKNL